MRGHHDRAIALSCALAVGLVLCGCGWGDTEKRYLDPSGSSSVAATACGVAPTAPPASFGLSSFYAQYVDANGIPILASANAHGAALGRACLIVEHMLAKRDDVRQALIAESIRVAILAQNEVTTEIPEYHDLNSVFPLPMMGNWDTYRGVGATRARPVASCGEENLLCLVGDQKQGEVTLVFTFGVSMELGIERVDSGFQMRLNSTYSAANAAGLWANTYSMNTSQNAVDDYWGEGAQAWFDAYKTPPDASHNDINTRDKLKAYDPMLASLLGTYMPDDAWRPSCPP